MTVPRPFLHRGIEMRPEGDGWTGLVGPLGLRLYRRDKGRYWTGDVYAGRHLLGRCTRRTRAEALDDAIGHAAHRAERMRAEAQSYCDALTGLDDDHRAPTREEQAMGVLRR